MDENVITIDQFVHKLERQEPVNAWVEGVGLIETEFEYASMRIGVTNTTNVKRIKGYKLYIPPFPEDATEANLAIAEYQLKAYNEFTEKVLAVYKKLATDNARVEYEYSMKGFNEDFLPKERKKKEYDQRFGINFVDEFKKDGGGTTVTALKTVTAQVGGFMTWLSIMNLPGLAGKISLAWFFIDKFKNVFWDVMHEKEDELRQLKQEYNMEKRDTVENKKPDKATGEMMPDMEKNLNVREGKEQRRSFNFRKRSFIAHSRTGAKVTVVYLIGVEGLKATYRGVYNVGDTVAVWHETFDSFGNLRAVTEEMRRPIND